jgi:hypothetical protein
MDPVRSAGYSVYFTLLPAAFSAPTLARLFSVGTVGSAPPWKSQMFQKFLVRRSVRLRPGMNAARVPASLQVN